MKTLLCLVPLVLTAALALADDKETVEKAVAGLAAKDNYSWTIKSSGGQGNEGPHEGKLLKGGPAHIKLNYGERASEVVMQGELRIIKTDDGWQTPEEMGTGRGGGGGGRRGGFGGRTQRLPHELAVLLLKHTKAVKKGDDGSFESELGKDAIKELMQRGRPGGGGGNAPAMDVKDGKGRADFWVKEGALSKLVLEYSATIDFDGNEREFERAQTYEMKDVGTTKLQLPKEAADKLASLVKKTSFEKKD